MKRIEKENIHTVSMTYLCKDYTGELEILKPEKHSELGWFSLDDLPSPQFEASRLAIEMFRLTHLKQSLSKLRSEAVEMNLSAQVVQGKLSGLLYSYQDVSQNMERIVNRYDNELELVIYTTETNHQLKATLGVIDEVLGFF